MEAIELETTINSRKNQAPDLNHVVAPSKSDSSAINAAAATSVKDAKQAAHYK
jgi:hypothetical protein